MVDSFNLTKDDRFAGYITLFTNTDLLKVYTFCIHVKVYLHMRKYKTGRKFTSGCYFKDQMKILFCIYANFPPSAFLLNMLTRNKFKRSAEMHISFILC